METNFNFKSQICTTREQSERLLALGLKKETADMIYERNVQYPYDYDLPRSIYEGEEFITGVKCDDIPAWSLGRLIKDLMPQSIGSLELAVGGEYVGYYKDEYDGMEWKYSSETPDMFDNIISTIEWLIKEGYFNKEYLV